MKIFSPRKLDELLNNPCLKASGIAQVAGITGSALNAIRRGKRSPGYNTLAAIAQALNKPMDYFLEDENLVQQQKLPLCTKEVVNG